MKHLLLLLLSLPVLLFAQSEADRVRIPLNDYITGTSYNYPAQIEQAFIDSATLYLNDRDGNARIFSPKAYAALFAKREAGQFNGRKSRILSVNLHQEVAYAEIEVVIEAIQARFLDLILLKRIGEDWKIISKTATRYPLVPDYEGPVKRVIMEGLRKPWSMAFLSETEVLIAEKDGDLLRVDLATQSRQAIQGFPEDLFQPFVLDVSRYEQGIYPTSLDGKEIRANAGILEVLVDPDFAQNKFVYVSYVSQQGERFALKVIRARLEDNRLTEIRTLLNPGPYVPGLYHFGGGMCFGPDGMLYITAGERLFFEYVKQGLPIAQDVSDARGKIYRLHPDGRIPADNPDFGPEAVKGLYAFGIRAAQGLTVEPGTGRIWFSEHGTIQGDEINVLRAGANYGWPNVTSGRYRSPDYQPDALPNPVYTDPVHFWKQTVAPTGLVFYSGTQFPNWYGDLIVPGLSRGSLWRIDLQGTTVKAVHELFPDDRLRLRKAEMSPGGKLYLLTDEENGKLIEVIPQP